MVMSNIARADSDTLFFNGDKVILYHQVTETEDLTYGCKTLSYTTYSLPAQGNILSWSDRMVRAGLLAEGDAGGVLRYEYTTDSDGNTISPALVPYHHDEFTFLGHRFRFNKLTPQMSEDHKIILFTFSASPVSSSSDSIFPLDFPIQF